MRKSEETHGGDRIAPAFDNAASLLNKSSKSSKQAGRPGNPRSAKKYPSPITFRPTDEERAMLKADAGDMSQSAYIRKCLFGRRASKRIVPEVDHVLLAQILARLGERRIANNLNQIAYHANCGSLLLDDVTVEELNEACLHVAWMRVKLIEALGLKSRKISKSKPSANEAVAGGGDTPNNSSRQADHQNIDVE